MKLVNLYGVNCFFQEKCKGGKKSRIELLAWPISKSVSSRRKRALSKAKTILPRVMGDPEIEMRYLKEKRKVDDSIYTVDP